MKYLVEVRSNGRQQRDIKYDTKKQAINFLGHMISKFGAIVDTSFDQEGDPKSIAIVDTSSSYTIVKAPLYITTPKFYFFVVKAEVNANLLEGCKIHQSMEAMYSYASKHQGIDLDCIEGNEFTITKDKIAYDSRGCTDGEPLESVEDYLKTFEM